MAIVSYSIRRPRGERPGIGRELHSRIQEKIGTVSHEQSSVAVL
jgi:hypothetical protein